MIQIIDNELTIRILQKKFIQRLSHHLNLSTSSIVGFPGGTIETIVNYSVKYDIWLAIDNDIENRYWNGFGFGSPEDQSIFPLSAEINFPKKGINKRIGGVFGKDDNGNFLLLHRGKIGGGRPGIGKQLFMENYRGEFVTVIDGNTTCKLALICDLESTRLVRQVTNFLKEVKRIKDQNVSLKNAEEILKDSNNNFSREFAGTKKYTKQEIIQMRCDHGIVVNTLADELKHRNFQIGNDKNRDLYIKTSKGEIRAIFEIKTDTHTGSLYSAIGQLILYSIGLDQNAKLFLVLPDQLRKPIENKIQSIGLNILYYAWKGDRPIFKFLDEKMAH